MTTQFYSFSSSSCYTNDNGKESFIGLKQENNNGRVKAEMVSKKDGLLTKQYYDNFLPKKNKGNKRIAK